MLPTNRLIRFFCIIALLYGLLMVPWPGLRETYSVAYRAAGNLIFGTFGSDGFVRFQARPSAGNRCDTEIIMVRRNVEIANALSHDPHRQAYLPTATIIALILATPLPWVRRLTALLWGLAGIHAFIVLRMAITLLHRFDGHDPWCLYALTPLLGKVLYGAYEIIVRSGTSSFLIPVFLWILVCFRRADFQTALDGARGTDALSTR